MGTRRILNTFRPIVFMKFHTAEEWDARNILTSADYNIYNLISDLISMDENVKREYLCFAMPIGRDISPIN